MTNSSGTPTMKAAIWEGHPYNVSIRKIPRPTIQDPGDIIVKLSLAAICGSDLHIYHGIYGSQDQPWPLGHEGLGTVDEVGSGVQTLKVGDRVVIPDGIVVGQQGYTYGQGVINFDGLVVQNLGGLQAEYGRVINADMAALKLPSSGSSTTQGTDEDFITLSDIFCTAWGGLTESGFQAGNSVAIFGAGPVGLLVAYSALLRGASVVYSIDHVPARLAKAKSIGAVPIDLTKGDPADQIIRLNGGIEITRVIDAIGYECVNEKLEPDESYVTNEAIKLVAYGGSVFAVGVYYAGKPNRLEPRLSEKLGYVKFPIAQLWAKNATFGGGGIQAGPLQPTLLQLIESGRAKPGFVVDKTVSIDEVPEAYRLFSNHEVEKVVIKF